MNKVAIMSMSLVLFFLICGNGEHRYSSMKDTASPKGRDEYRAMIRDFSMTPEKMLSAKRLVGEKINSKPRHARDAGINQWTELGRHNLGGRIRAIATHPTDPSVIFVGAASGGIWKTNDGGQQWIPLNDLLPSLSVSSIIIHPLHPDTMYVSTGEVETGGDPEDAYGASTPGAGIFRSLDGGQSWNLVPALDPDNLGDFYWVGHLAFDPVDPSKFYVGTNGTSMATPGGAFGSLYLFESHGSTKTHLTGYTSLASVGKISTIKFNPLDSDHFVVCHSQGLAITHDKGSTFFEANNGFPASPGRVEADFSHSNANTMYAVCQHSGTVLFSSNQGTNWIEMSTNPDFFEQIVGGEIYNQGWYNNTLWVDPLDHNTILVGGIDMWRSTNSGINFTKITDNKYYISGTSLHADHHVIAPASDFGEIINGSQNRTLYFGNDGGFGSCQDFTTADTTSGWSLLNGTGDKMLGIAQYHGSDLVDTVIISGSQDNGSFMSCDRGQSFSRLDGGDGGYCAISRQDTRQVYMSQQYGKFKITIPSFTCGTLAFDYIDLNGLPGEDPPFFCPIKTFPLDGNKVIIGGSRLWQITTDPTTYVPSDTLEITPPFILAYITAIDISDDGSTVVVGTQDGAVYLGTVGNTYTWDQIYNQASPISSVDFAPNNTQKIVIAKGGYYDDNIFITNDGGTTWLSRSAGIPALHVNVVRWHPSQSTWIYAGTDLGVFSSENAGGNWNVSPNYHSISDGPVFTEVTGLHFSESNQANLRFLYAFTYGRGIWRTSKTIQHAVHIDEDYLGTDQFGTYSNPFDLTEKAEEVQANGQTWYFDVESTSTDPTTLYPVPAGIVIDKRIGLLRKRDNKKGGFVIGEN